MSAAPQLLGSVADVQFTGEGVAGTPLLVVDTRQGELLIPLAEDICTRIDPAANYRVTVNNYLSVGGDSFTTFKGGTAQQVGGYDVDALYDYFKANSPIAATAGNRIARMN